MMFTAKWIHDDFRLKRKIPSVSQNFTRFYTFPEPVYLPKGVFLDIAGKPVDFSNYRGQYLIVNVWATWCKPCITELPSLQKLHNIINEDGKWRVVAISIDRKEDLLKVAEFTRRTNTEDIANYYDHEAKIQANLPLNGLPTTYIVNASGRMVFEVRGGGLWDAPDIVDFLRNFEKVY